MLEVPYHWKEALPLHMCDFSDFNCIFLLGGPKFFLILHLLGYGGATMALITPDVEIVLIPNITFSLLGMD